MEGFKFMHGVPTEKELRESLPGLTDELLSIHARNLSDVDEEKGYFYGHDMQYEYISPMSYCYALVYEEVKKRIGNSDYDDIFKEFERIVLKYGFDKCNIERHKKEYMEFWEDEARREEEAKVREAEAKERIKQLKREMRERQKEIDKAIKEKQREAEKQQNLRRVAGVVKLREDKD